MSDLQTATKEGKAYEWLMSLEEPQRKAIITKLCKHFYISTPKSIHIVKKDLYTGTIGNLDFIIDGTVPLGIKEKENHIIQIGLLPLTKDDLETLCKETDPKKIKAELKKFYRCVCKQHDIQPKKRVKKSDYYAASLELLQ